MEEQKELTVLSELSTISIKNYSNALHINFVPQLGAVLEAASMHQPPNTIGREALSVATKIHEVTSVVRVSEPSPAANASKRTLSVKEKPLEIVIENPLDEDTLLNLTRLMGEHSPKTITEEEARTLVSIVDQQDVIDTLKYQRKGVRIVFRLPEKIFQPLMGLPPAFTQFTGREDELKALRAHQEGVQVISAHDGDDADEDSVTSQIAGSGGIGKSTLANFFARQQFREKKYAWVLWLNGGLDDKNAENNLQAQLAWLGSEFGFDSKQIKIRDLSRLIYKKLFEKGKGLIVFDDMPNASLAAAYSPEAFDLPKMDILITTRNGRHFGKGVKKIILDVFTLKDAKQYIHRMLEIPVSEGDAELLAVTLGRYPLAITQAIAYINDNKCSVQTFCERYKQNLKARKAYLSEPVPGADPYEQERRLKEGQYKTTMIAVVQLSLDQIKANSELGEAIEQLRNLLIGVALLAPESAIPKSLLCQWVPNDPDEVEINQYLSVLRQFSLLEESDGAQSYRIHQVIQDVLMIIEDKKPAEIEQILHQVCRYVHACYYSRGKLLADEMRRQALFPHLQELKKKIEVCNSKDEVDTKKVLLNIMIKIGSIYRQQGQDALSEKLLNEAERFYQACGFNDLKPLIDIFSTLGAVYGNLRNPREQERVLLRALDLVREEYGAEHRNMFGDLNNLADAYLHLGRYQEASSVIERAEKIYAGTTDIEECFYAQTLATKASICSHLGDPKRGLEYRKMAIEILVRTLEPEHLYLAGCYADLGGDFGEIGDDHACVEYLEKAISIRERHFGADHPATLEIKLLLCEWQRVEGDAKEAYQMLMKILVVQQGEYDESHHMVAKTKYKIAKALMSMGSYKEAYAYLQSALAVLTAFYGDSHVNLNEIEITKCHLLCDLGEEKEALRLIDQVIQKCSAYYGANNHHLERAYSAKAEILLDLGETKDAKKFIKKALKMQSAFFGSRHPRTVDSLILLADVYRQEGQNDKAKKQLVIARKIIGARFGRNHPKNIHLNSSLGLVCLAQGHDIEALALHYRALMLSQKDLKPDHPEIATTLSLLATDYASLGNRDKTIELIDQALAIQRAYYRNAHPDILNSLLVKGNALGAKGDAVSALELFEEAFLIQEDYYGKNHPILISTLKCIGEALVEIRQVGLAKQRLACAEMLCRQFEKGDSVVYADVMANLANAYSFSGQMDKAIDYQQKALKIIMIKRGKSDALLAKSLMNLCSYYLQLSNPVKAEPYIKKAIEIQTKKFGLDHVETAMSRANGAIVLWKMNNYLEALKEFVAVVKIYIRYFGKHHPKTTQIHRIIFEFLADAAKFTLEASPSLTEYSVLIGAKSLFDRFLMLSETEMEPQKVQLLKLQRCLNESDFDGCLALMPTCSEEVRNRLDIEGVKSRSEDKRTRTYVSQCVVDNYRRTPRYTFQNVMAYVVAMRVTGRHKEVVSVIISMIKVYKEPAQSAKLFGELARCYLLSEDYQNAMTAAQQSIAFVNDPEMINLGTEFQVLFNTTRRLERVLDVLNDLMCQSVSTVTF